MASGIKEEWDIPGTDTIVNLHWAGYWEGSDTDGSGRPIPGGLTVETVHATCINCHQRVELGAHEAAAVEAIEAEAHERAGDY